MRLATVRDRGAETAAVVTTGGVATLEALNRVYSMSWSTDLFFLVESGEFFKLQEWLGRLQNIEETVPPGRLAYGPLYRRPRKIWGIGLNYTGHAGDLDAAPPEEPASFMKPDTTIIGPEDNILLPESSAKVTAEAELGVVIGRRIRNISPEEALSAIAGFVPVIDMTAEDILRRNPRYLTRAKSFDTFFSFGPELVTPDEIGEVSDLTVSTVLNGEVRRENTVSNMAFSPEELVSFHSGVMTLLPGDIISTGTPGAVEIKNGDRISCRITGFAPLSNPVG